SDAPRAALGLMKLSREQPATASAATTTPAMRTSLGPGTAALPGDLEAAPELGLAAGADGDLALELAAGGVDVVAAGAAHGRDHAGAVEQLLERPDRRLVRPLVARARERVERDQVDLGGVLHLHRAVEGAQQLHQFERVLRLVVDALHQRV